MQKTKQNIIFYWGEMLWLAILFKLKKAEKELKPY